MAPDTAKAEGQRSDENPAASFGHLKMVLPKRTMLSREHHASLQYREVPDFVQRLRHREGIAPLALEFWILN